MLDHFNILHIAEYLKRLGLKISHLNHKQKTIDLTFNGSHGQWRMVVGIHHSGNTSKLMLIAPHISVISDLKRQECLEALLAVNYRIAIGKFGIDLEDGEVRLEESIPLAEESISFDQFQLAFSALMQTVSIYQNLFAHIINEDLSPLEAIQVCENDFFTNSDYVPTFEITKLTNDEQGESDQESESTSDLDVNDVMAEVSRLLGYTQE
ncbi:YbjN domain-containing protein [Dictyobacter arantiisoli]|uniref:YbjN domain-containing protein n=1 Tax=Dictyobacter arantiisoli TaxID=2014874 RepID=A0A5A5T9F9_9CHLR|nr:YbjN domain-containing protein [Dictyobacter arantiisoli]GCF07629.1 hypothetical protein KDI_11930 [Dictyobacter arantiisoli]